jgi:hypothetical protein
MLDMDTPALAARRVLHLQLRIVAAGAKKPNYLCLKTIMDVKTVLMVYLALILMMASVRVARKTYPGIYEVRH